MIKLMKGLVFIHETRIVAGSGGVLRTFAKVDMKIFKYIHIYMFV